MKTMLLISAALLTASAASAQPAAGTPNVGITKAVAAAERTLSANAMEAELDSDDGSLAIEIELLRGDELHEVRVDPASGKVITANKPMVEGAWRGMVDEEMKSFARLNKPLAPLLARLEKETGGTVQEVSFDVERGIPYYEVEMATQAGVTEMQVDARSGERLPAGFDD